MRSARNSVNCKYCLNVRHYASYELILHYYDITQRNVISKGNWISTWVELIDYLFKWDDVEVELEKSREKLTQFLWSPSLGERLPQILCFSTVFLMLMVSVFSQFVPPTFVHLMRWYKIDDGTSVVPHRCGIVVCVCVVGVVIVKRAASSLHGNCAAAAAAVATLPQLGGPLD